ncbi:3-deoxy-D-manno-octulosonic acid transferase [Castellaniella defragrans]|uniref:3-deoxy-D-manno-octulosonic acid transferase n=1 Tax=Castellaniella defragrans (strain DSM 12143 / CCUG 39792 / 65Phen) TaxID=1437824 RepID=W8X1W8_CASD6|nr:glycosyltransferase N-terminal domain-containing protein [Castellaniella defragrans]CDM22896.1 3-deoxy-D-manno-octulosonic-acid transferase [Castellaniella defragrans 65Phen]
MRALYSLLLRILSPLLLAWMALRARRAGGRWSVLGAARFGCYPGAARDPGAVWVHAVSLGETRAAHPLIRALLDRGHRVLLTHLTATGWAEGGRVYAAELADGRLRQAWLPYDFPGAARRFLRHYRPAVGVLIEREVWPNLVHAAARAEVPLVLASARMSAASLRVTLRLGALLRPAYGALTRTYAQSLADARRLERAGARQVAVSGNFKFDLRLDRERMDRGADFAARLGRRIVVIASTREGEDAPFVEAIRREIEQRRARGEDCGRPLLFILVPRHPERFEAAAGLLRAAGLPHVRRSRLLELGDGGSTAVEACRDAAVILGDTLGEMAWYYACAQVAIVGGSFAPLGGQNFIEASAQGRPVLVGPHTAHFEQAVADALAAGAIARAADPAQAVRQALRWLDDPAALHRVGEAARDWVRQHAGAVTRVVDGIEDLLARPPRRPPGA